MKIEDNTLQKFIVSHCKKKFDSYIIFIMENRQIKILSDPMIHKISAGEVIERPLSIVKELVENSIDANAKSITVEIKNGGINFIRVTDNGNGIEKNQVTTAFLNHATNKINSFDDFESLMTLGFRGEALCTIAAISRVEMTTKTQNEILGTNIKIHGGKIIAQKEVGCTCGTTIISENIFYNTPARLKFLKKSSVEASYISNMMNRFALSNPQVSFKFINNGKIFFTTNGNGNLKSALMYIMGKEIAKNALEVKNLTNKFSLSGFIAKPEFSRSSRTYQNFFINGRYIKNNVVSTAIENAYKNRIMIGQFPVYVLNLSVDPKFIDVNVHPAKMEIRFANDDLVYDFIFNTITNTFKNKTLIPCAKIEIKNKNSETEKNSISEHHIFQENRTKFENSLPEVNFSQPEEPVQIFIEKNLAADEKELVNDYKIVGQIFNTYWIIEQNQKIFIMDQHAAHERILFEQIKHQYETEQIFPQQLLIPLNFHLNEYDAKTLIDNIGQIKQLGFDIHQLSEKKFKIKGVPHDLNKYISKNFFLDLIDSFREITHDNEKKMYEIMQKACKKAVKANDNLSYTEIKELIKKIMAADNPFNCPHGRPTLIQITQNEIEKMFGRKK